jgi:hypothetical protein
MCDRISTPRINGDNTGMEGIFVPRAVVNSDDKAGSVFGIAEDVSDQSFVDIHTAMEGNGGIMSYQEGDDSLLCNTAVAL